MKTRASNLQVGDIFQTQTVKRVENVGNNMIRVHYTNGRHWIFVGDAMLTITRKDAEPERASMAGGVFLLVVLIMWVMYMVMK